MTKNKEHILAILRTMKPRLYDMQVGRIRLFGSAATDHLHDQSDVDLLLDFKRSPTLFDLCEIKSDLEEKLGMPVDLAQPENLFPPLRDRILSEAIDV